MLKFKFLLWVLTKLLQRAVKRHPACAKYVEGKNLVFQMQTREGVGRHFSIKDGRISSRAGLTPNPEFTLTFKDAAKGFAILSAKDGKEAFLSALRDGDLVISGDFVEVMWFQGLTEYLQPAKSSQSAMSNTPPSKTNLLNQPMRLPNGRVLKNRLAKSSMSETLGTYDNHATLKLVELYRRWASSGIGLMFTGNVMIDRRALGEPCNVAIEDEADLPVLQQWARAATDQGAALWVQLNHPGKQSPKGLNERNLSPSAIPFREDMAAFFETPREITSDEIIDIIHRFGRSAAICKKAGFSGVQIHGAHGYLVSQFLSPHHNQRTDEWGGSPENRRRFLMATYAEIRRQVGPDFPVGIKLNSADFQRGGFTEDESMATIRALAEVGIDLIEISGGTYEAPAMSGTFQSPQKATTVEREAYFLEFAQKVRTSVDVPLMVTGGFRTVEGMNAALRSGALDMVGLARLLAMDPEAPAALLQGRNSTQSVRPIATGIKPVDRMGIMEVLWYTRQLRRIAEGGNPQPNESGLMAFLKSLMSSRYGSYRTRRLRAQ